jgi:hypothetical protein
MKIKTFLKTEETEINEFLKGIRIITDGVYQTDTHITFSYIEGKYPVESVENELGQLYSELLDNSRKTKSLNRDLTYIDRKEVEESDGKDKRAVKKTLAKLEIDRDMIQEDIDKLA